MCSLKDLKAEMNILNTRSVEVFSVYKGMLIEALDTLDVEKMREAIKYEHENMSRLSFEAFNLGFRFRKCKEELYPRDANGRFISKTTTKPI